LQARWAEENGVEIRPARFRGDRRGEEEVLLAQAEAFAPDVCYIQNLDELSARTLHRLGREAMLVGQLSTEPPKRRRLRGFDLLVTPMPFWVDRFRRQGIACEYMPLAFDTRAPEHLGPGHDEPSWDAVFVGSLKRFRRWSSNRVLGRAAARVRIDFWGYGAEQWSRSSPVRRHYHGNAWGLDMLRVLRDSRVAVNRHGDVSGDYASNMRLFEATGMGTLLITEAKRNLAELFVPGQEVVTYANEDELVDRIQHYLANEDERAAIAAAGRARTFEDHSYARRMGELAAIIESERRTT
jgi:spore maturation protein CgeB